MNTKFKFWLSHIVAEIDFYERALNRFRRDHEYDWNWWMKVLGIKGVLKVLFKSPYRFYLSLFFGKNYMDYSKQWIENNAMLLFDTRQKLEDDISKIEFDRYLVLRSVGPFKFFFNRYSFEPIFEYVYASEFRVSGLPQHYGKLPLANFDLILKSPLRSAELKIVSPYLNLDLYNRYHQYFLTRPDVTFVPEIGDVVFDCGACIGDFSLIYASQVGSTGKVYTFDPVPLHSQFIQHHKDINPLYGEVIVINELAVDSSCSNKRLEVSKTVIEDISPGGLVIENYDSITLDDYVVSNHIDRVNLIKMDIEGYELNALIGAKKILNDFKPKLAICVYHKPSDLWEIISTIIESNPSYRFYFAHHSPVEFEAVLYAY